MTPIPLCVVEEHHEAFFVWRWAAAHGIIRQTGNMLLHVDQHADVGSPRLRRPLPDPSASLADAYRFTYDELCCFEFIVPAIYQRLLDHVVWVQWRPAQTASQLVFVRPGNDTATAFTVDARNVEAEASLPQLPASFPGGAARYRLQSPETPLPSADSVILDIDLDFASCEDAANQMERLAVTREAYESFKTDRYHFLRITQGSRIALVEEDGGHYVYLRRFDERAPTPLRVDEAEILRRLDILTARLREDAVRPALVVIARSRFSGFTAADQWAFIESALVERLRTLYELDVFTVDSLARRLGVAEAWPGVAPGSAPMQGPLPPPPNGALARHLDAAVAPGLPAALVSSSSLEAMRDLAAALPASLTEFFGLECRLWDESAEADFLLHVSSPEGRQALAAWSATAGGDATAADAAAATSANNAWARLHEFAAAWSNPAHALHERIGGTWLEFDLADGAAAAALSRTPSLFMSTHIDGGPRPHQEGDAAGDDDWLCDMALPLLLGRAAADRHRTQLRPVLDALPATAHVFQVGAMLSRASDALRLCIRGLTEGQTLTFLAAVHWPGVAAELAPWLADAYALSDSVDLDVDVGRSVHAKIGLECSCLQRPAPHGRQAGFLDHLVERGLCTPAKSDGLRVWPRGFHERSNPETWPSELRDKAREIGGGTISMFLRWLYHVKLVVQPGTMPAAKAYLAVRQVWPNPTILPHIASSGEAYVSGTASTNRA